MNASEVFGKKLTLEEQIRGIGGEIRALPEIPPLEAVLQGEKNRLQTYLNCHNEPRERYVADVRNYIKGLEKSIQEKTEELESITSRKNSLEGHRAKLEKQLSQLDLSFSLDAVKEVQAEWLSLEDQLKTLQKALSGVEVTENVNSKILPELNKLKVLHEDALADIALGIDGADERLRKIETQLPKLQERYDVDLGKEVAQEKAAAGLRRKIDEVSRLIPDAKKKYSTALARLIQDAIDNAGSEYLAQAEQFAKTFMRIVAMGKLCGSLGAKVNIYGPRTNYFEIPAFNVAPCKEFLQSHIFDFSKADTEPAIDLEVERLKEQGLVLPS